uniref:Uncharacterized protein n=1 Tax=Suricata suricatta TaxID=37032 RepID=A0A673T178_SURSU
MECFVQVPYGLCQGYGPAMPLGQPGLCEHRQPDWRRNPGPPTFLARTGWVMPANASDYFMDPSKRVRLKAILSQMNPSLRFCKASTREVGVQVSPRMDKSVQCSLGSHTLHSCSPWGSTGHKVPLLAWGIYSPAKGRRNLTQLQKEGEDQERKALLGPVEASQQQQQSLPMPRSEEDKQEELCQHEFGEEDQADTGSRRSRSAQKTQLPEEKQWV